MTTGEVIALIKAFGGSGGGGSSGGGVLVVTNNEGTLDKTWQEIHDATLAVYKDGNNTNIAIYANFIINVQSGAKTYIVRFTDSSSATTDSPDGYPVLVDE